MSSFERALDSAGRDFAEVMRQLNALLSDLTPAQQVLALCGFVLVLMWLMVRRPGTYENNGEMRNQFWMALIIVLVFGLGAGFMIAPGLAFVNTIS